MPSPSPYCFCLAWGGEGHQLVALIAEDQLTPAAKAMITDLLGADVHISDAEVASWADEIRRERRDTADWHYVNIPSSEKAFDRQRDGRKGDNVIDKLTEQAKILADKSQPKEKRAEALKWVVHLAGDIEQPLHCSDRNGDRGGNSRLVFYPGRHEAVSLHFVWDTLLVRDIVGKQRIVAAAQALVKGTMQSDLNEFPKGTPEDWANHSHFISRISAYDTVPADGPPPHLSDEYVRSRKDYAKGQLVRGGLRLAKLLNAATAAK